MTAKRGLLGLALLLAIVAGCGSTPSAAPVRLRTAYLLQVHTTVLVSGGGFALYMFLPDHQGAVTCTTACAASWPPLRVPGNGRVDADPGVNAKLVGTGADPGGGRVATYNRWPLYTFEPDVQPGIATGQATDLNGGYWYLLRPDGSPLIPPGDPGAR